MEATARAGEHLPHGLLVLAGPQARTRGIGLCRLDIELGHLLDHHLEVLDLLGLRGNRLLGGKQLLGTASRRTGEVTGESGCVVCVV